ncbi:hypothetical protein KC19_5G166200 [Ceratodon purpureus]|uniref:Uncharacterized protein n=1 Tax=Ceratodon purpureus TaxID=3225 RepID=A0A8T0I494_CERPU|nr:hypothetical protein KC19_5G166200 [Ceratodon purpureus]
MSESRTGDGSDADERPLDGPLEAQQCGARHPAPVQDSNERCNRCSGRRPAHAQLGSPGDDDAGIPAGDAARHPCQPTPTPSLLPPHSPYLQELPQSTPSQHLEESS